MSVKKTLTAVAVVAERSVDVAAEHTPGEMTADPASVAEMIAAMMAIVDSKADATLETIDQTGATWIPLAVAVMAFVEREADAVLVADTATDAHAHHHALWTPISRTFAVLVAHLPDVVLAHARLPTTASGVYY